MGSVRAKGVRIVVYLFGCACKRKIGSGDVVGTLPGFCCEETDCCCCFAEPVLTLLQLRYSGRVNGVVHERWDG